METIQSHRYDVMGYTMDITFDNTYPHNKGKLTIIEIEPDKYSGWVINGFIESLSVTS